MPTVANVLCHLAAKYGGMSISVPELARATCLEGRYKAVLVGLATVDEDQAFDCPELYAERVEYKGIRLIADLGFLRDIGRISQHHSVDIFHIHGVWDRHCSSTGWLARRHSIPYVVSSHGMLEPWAVRNKAVRKFIYAAFVERSNLERASFLRALTTDEIEDYLRFGVRTPMGVIPNGVTVPESISPDLLFQNYPELSGQRIMLFLSRIHPKKGLDQLLPAFAALARQFSDWHFVIAGPDSVGTRHALEGQALELGVNHRVTFTGILTGDLKWSALASADFFVLPSHSEGFSMAVLESLGAGTPVMITPGCKFPQVDAAMCGWTADPATQSLERCLREILPLRKSELAAMGERGRKMVATQYVWPVIGKQMTEVYDWLLGGSQPSSVEVIGRR